MNKKFIKITAIVIAAAFLLGLFAQFAFMFAFAEPSDRLDAANKIETDIIKTSREHFRIMCEKGLGSYIDIIFSAKSPSDFVDRIVIAKELTEYDKNMIKAVSKIKNKILSEESVN